VGVSRKSDSRIRSRRTPFKSDKSNREGFPVFVADRLEAVKWRNWKVVFYDEQGDWRTPPVKLGTPKAFDFIREALAKVKRGGRPMTDQDREAFTMLSPGGETPRF
jgi:hypothetical protein